MAIFGGKSQTVDSLKLFDFFQGIPAKGSFTFKSVEDDSFEKVSEGHIFELRDGLEDFEQPFFEADTSLNALDFDMGHWYICTNVLRDCKCLCPEGTNEGSQAVYWLGAPKTENRPRGMVWLDQRRSTV